MNKGCEYLGKCEEMIGKLGLFSANETKEDISTTNLKYLLVSVVCFSFAAYDQCVRNMLCNFC